MIPVLALIFVVVLVVVVAHVVRQLGPTEADVAWLLGPGLSQSASTSNGTLHHTLNDSWNDDAATVCTRYLTRHRRHRMAGGAFGVLFAAIVGVRWFGSVTIGMGQGSPLADLLFCGVTGVIVGTLSAESFRLTTTSTNTSATQRTASLDRRQSSAGTAQVAASRTVAVAALAVGVIAALTGQGNLALVTSLILVVPLGVAELVMVVIAGRSRPAMTDRARQLDDRLRAFAGASLSHLHVATTALMLGWTLAKVDSLGGFLAFGRFVIVAACLVVAIVMLRRAAPRPTDRVLVERDLSFA